MKKIYVACPYSSENNAVICERVHQANLYTAYLMEQGVNVFSPISYGHPLQNYLPNERKTDHDYWLERELQWLIVCDELHVLCLEGWKESNGVGVEIEFAKENNIEIRYIEVEP